MVEGGQHAYNAQKKVYSLPVVARSPGVAVEQRRMQTSGGWLLLAWCPTAECRKLRASFAPGLVPPNCCPCVLSCSCWSLLHRGNLVKHADQIPPLSRDHSQDKQPVWCSRMQRLAPSCHLPVTRVPHLPLHLHPFLSQDLPSSLPRGLPASRSPVRSQDPTDQNQGSVTCGWALRVCPSPSLSLFLCVLV